MANTASKVIEVAKKEVGYLEKRTNAWLSSKTKNAGSNNYTKYGKWFGMNGVYWCAIFVSLIFNKAFGKTKAKKLLCGNFSASSETLRQQFIKADKYAGGKTTPKKGYIIFFIGSRHNGANHIGLVYKVEGGRVYTIEGNTSGGSTVVDNGGGVAYKSYPIGYEKILGYGKPSYDKDISSSSASASSVRPASLNCCIASSLAEIILRIILISAASSRGFAFLAVLYSINAVLTAL